MHTLEINTIASMMHALFFPANHCIILDLNNTVRVGIVGIFLARII